MRKLHDVEEDMSSKYIFRNKEGDANMNTPIIRSAIFSAILRSFLMNENLMGDFQGALNAMTDVVMW